MATVLIRDGGLIIRDGDWLLEDPITLTPVVPTGGGGGGYGGVAIRKQSLEIIRDIDRERKKKEDVLVALVLLLDSQ